MSEFDLVTLGDYESLFSDQDAIRDLTKALAAGSDINNPGTASGEGFPLRVESLDNTLKVLTLKQEDLVFWRDVPKSPAYNTVEEFNRLLDVGNEEGIFISEGALPEEDDSTYERAYTLIKYMGTVRRITHPMLLVKTMPANIVAQETQNGTLKLLRGLERALWEGDSYMSDLMFDGFFRQFIDGINQYAVGAGHDTGSSAWFQDIDTVLDTDLMQDMRGDPITEDEATELVTIASEDPNHARISDVYLPFRVGADFSKQFYPKERSMGLINTKGDAGVVVNRWHTPFGAVSLKPSKFIKMSTYANQSGAGSTTKRPAVPASVTATAQALSAGNHPGFHGTTQGRTADAAVDGAGNYYYQVVACNRYGKSAPASVGPVSVAVGEEVVLHITDGSPAGVTEWYEIYRTNANATAATQAGYIFAAKRTGATQDVTDVNRFLPFTGRAYWVQRNKDAMAWKQLLPLLKVDLPMIDLTKRFALILYGAFALFAPRKHGVMINIGRL